MCKTNDSFQLFNHWTIYVQEKKSLKSVRAGQVTKVKKKNDFSSVLKKIKKESLNKIQNVHTKWCSHY